MSEEIRLVALRIRDLREMNELSCEDVAAVLDIPADKYIDYESGETDIPVSLLYQLSKYYHVELTALLTGEDPHMEDFFVVRRGKGVSVDRRKDYKYQNLAYGMANRIMEPFLVTIDPSDQEPNQYAHPGHEYSYVLEGRVQIRIDRHTVVLEPGDSMYYKSSCPHGLKALGGTPAKLLCVIVQE